MLLEELHQIRSNLIQNENRLAQLHANIYKRREEARKIRLSMPTPEYLDRVKLTDPVMEKLQQKKKNTLYSISRLHEHTRKDLEIYNNQSSKFPYYLKMMLWVAVLTVVGFYLATRAHALLGDQPTACH